MRKSILNSFLLVSILFFSCKKNDTEIEPVSIPNPSEIVVGNWNIIQTKAVGNLTIANVNVPAEGSNLTPPVGYYNLVAGEDGAENTYTYNIQTLLQLRFGKNGNLTKEYNYDDKDAGTWELKSDQHIVFYDKNGIGQDVFFTKYDSSKLEVLQLALPVDTNLEGVDYEGKIIVDLVKND